MGLRCDGLGAFNVKVKVFWTGVWIDEGIDWTL
jgi:hypothetical protein